MTLMQNILWGEPSQYFFGKMLLPEVPKKGFFMREPFRHAFVEAVHNLGQPQDQ
jgi:hypothetical protein